MTIVNAVYKFMVTLYVYKLQAMVINVTVYCIKSYRGHTVFALIDTPVTETTLKRVSAVPDYPIG